MLRKFTVAALAIVMAGAAVKGPSAEVTFKFSGDVLYRWSIDWNKYRAVDGEVSTRNGDFQNRYWWNLRMSAIVNENLSLNARLSNPRGYYTDQVLGNLTWTGSGAGFNVVSIPELYFKWNVSVLTLLGGFIPVAGPGPNMYNSVLDLVAFETAGFGPGGYVNTGLMPWFVATNGSQAGLNAQVSLVKNDNISVGLDVLGTIAADSGASIAVDQIKKDQYRILVGVPMSFGKGKISLLPELHVRTNVARSADLEDANSSVTGGLDVIAKPLANPAYLQFRAGYAIGGYWNNARKEDSNYVASAPLGMVLNAGLKSSPGYGTMTVDFAWGNWRNRQADPIVLNNLLYWDIMFDAPIKSLVIRPRLRLWHWGNAAEGDDSSRLLARPEIDFIAKF